MNDIFMIKTTNLKKCFGKFTALSNINLEIFPGEIFVLLGPNGAGKTTTVKLLTGLLKPTSGKIFINGLDIEKETINVRKIIGLLPDSPFIYPKLTGKEYLKLVGNIFEVDPEKQKKRIPELLEMFDLSNDGDELIETYSQGMRQKIVLAGILLHEPKIYFLDEPLFGLDPKIAKLVKDILLKLAERGKTVFLCTHIMELAENISTRIGILMKGELIATGTKDNLARMSQNKDLEKIYLELTKSTDYQKFLKYL